MTTPSRNGVARAIACLCQQHAGADTEPIYPPGVGRIMKGMPVADVLLAVDNAMADADYDAYAEVIEQVDAFVGANPEPLPGLTPHGFLAWVQALIGGWAALPERIPAAVILAWRDNGPANLPLQRCRDCWLCLPANYKRCFTVCPGCESEHLQWAHLGRPPGEFVEW